VRSREGQARDDARADHRWDRGPARGHGRVRHIAETLAAAKAAAAGADQSAILWGTVSSGLALVAAAAVLGPAQVRLTPRLGALALILIVGTDLWLNARNFWIYSKPYGRDQVIDRITATPLPFRVFNPPGPGAYPGSALMAFDIADLFGYHGNELPILRRVVGGKNEWRNLGVLPLWDLWAVRYAILPAGAQTLDSIPGFRRVLDSVTIFDGARVNLFERSAPAPYARVVAAAIKVDSRPSSRRCSIPAWTSPGSSCSRTISRSRLSP